MSDIGIDMNSTIPIAKLLKTPACGSRDCLPTDPWSKQSKYLGIPGLSVCNTIPSSRVVQVGLIPCSGTSLKQLSNAQANEMINNKGFA
jgi:hypothetical protein